MGVEREFERFRIHPVWIAPTFTGSWANLGSGYSTAGYCIDAWGFVRLKGVVTGGGAAPIFTLPVGYRPTTICVFPTSANDAFGQVQVATTGVVSLTVGTRTGVCLDGISFYAG